MAMFRSLLYLGFLAAACGKGASGPIGIGDQTTDAMVDDAPAPADAPLELDAARDLDAPTMDPEERVPETTLLAGPSGDISAGTTATFEFVSDLAEATFECQVDAAGFAPCTSPHALVVAPGAHVFEVRARTTATVDPTPATRAYRGASGDEVRVRLVAGNVTSGRDQAYEEPGRRIFAGLHPDIAMIQEFNVGDNAPATIRAFVDSAFGSEFTFFRETGAQIPNGVISRYPIREAGIWEDPIAPNREFAFARIDVPGPADLWAVSVHLLTTNSKRPDEAAALVAVIEATIPPGDYLVIGGDFNTDARDEPAVVTLGRVVTVGAPFPVDQDGNPGTNANRSKPYDWVMLDPDLAARQTAVTIGGASYPGGLVFDSRRYAPLADVAPVEATDSGASNMQHMAVVKDVLLPAP